MTNPDIPKEVPKKNEKIPESSSPPVDTITKALKAPEKARQAAFQAAAEVSTSFDAKAKLKPDGTSEWINGLEKDKILSFKEVKRIGFLLAILGKANGDKATADTFVAYCKAATENPDDLALTMATRARTFLDAAPEDAKGKADALRETALRFEKVLDKARETERKSLDSQLEIGANILQTRERIGLVLGGGAIFGQSSIGAIEVLQREGIPISSITGSSMGSIIGLAMLRYVDPKTGVLSAEGIKYMKSVAKKLKTMDQWKQTKDGKVVLSLEEALNFTAKDAATELLSPLQLPPFWIMVEKKGGSKPVFLNSHNLKTWDNIRDAVRASAANPHFGYSPVNVKDGEGKETEYIDPINQAHVRKSMEFLRTEENDDKRPTVYITVAHGARDRGLVPNFDKKPPTPRDEAKVIPFSDSGEKHEFCSFPGLARSGVDYARTPEELTRFHRALVAEGIITPKDVDADLQGLIDNKKVTYDQIRNFGEKSLKQALIKNGLLTEEEAKGKSYQELNGILREELQNDEKDPEKKGRKAKALQAQADFVKPVIPIPGDDIVDVGRKAGDKKMLPQVRNILGLERLTDTFTK